MKTRIRRTKSKSNTYSTSIMVGFFITVMMYGILGDRIADISIELYVIGLFSIVPLYFLLLILGQKIYSYMTSKSIKYGFALLCISILLLLYIFTLHTAFLLVMIAVSLVFGFINYIPYLEMKHNSRISLFKLQSKYKRIFKTHLKNKNFLNHHNYYTSTKNELLYNKNRWRQGIISSLVTYNFIAFFMVMSSLDHIFDGSITLAELFGMYITILFAIISIGVIILLYKYISALIFGKSQTKHLELYQSKIQSSKFVRFRNKIFFY